MLDNLLITVENLFIDELHFQLSVEQVDNLISYLFSTSCKIIFGTKEHEFSAETNRGVLEATRKLQKRCQSSVAGRF